MTPALPSSVLVTGLVRNCALGIRADVDRVRRALQPFGRVQWLLVESDSSDDSLTQLEVLAGENPDFRFISLGTLRASRPLRTDRLAHCRNAYLAELRDNALYADVELVLVSDFDGVNTLLCTEGLLSCWQRDDWDVCTANQAGPYYDIWALRHPLWSPNDWYAAHQFLRRHGRSDEQALRVALHSRMITVAPKSDWIEVDSAFGGLGVYRRTALEGVHYDGLDATGAEVCEHVVLHQQMRQRGRRIFINPRLINTYGTEHSAALRLPNTLLRVARRPLQWAYDLLRRRPGGRPGQGEA